MPLSVDSVIKFFGTSFSGVAIKNTTTNIDYKMVGSKALFGAELIQQNGIFGDKIKFQVIDKDNILGYGANVVVHEWISDWFIRPNVDGWRVVSESAGTVLDGLYLRLVYISIGTQTDVNVAINLWFLTGI